MCQTPKMKMRMRNRNPLKNQRSQSQKARKKQSEAGSSVSQRNQKIPIRNESEPSAHCFWTESSDKGNSIQHFRPNIEPIYHLVLFTNLYKVELCCRHANSNGFGRDCCSQI